MATSSSQSQSNYVSAEFHPPDLISGPGDDDSLSSYRFHEVLNEFWIELKFLSKELFEYGRVRSWKKKVLTVVLCDSSALVFWDLIFGGYIVSWLEEFIMWMTNHSMKAVFAFIALFVVCTREYLMKYGIILHRGCVCRSPLSK